MSSNLIQLPAHSSGSAILRTHAQQTIWLPTGEDKVRRHEPRGRRPRRQADEDWQDVPQEDEEYVHEALKQWGSWCSRGNSSGPSRCMSIEGRYNPRSDSDRGALFRVQLKPPPAVKQSDELLCKRVNAALLRIPDEYRIALTHRYYKRLFDQAMARILRMRPKQYLIFIRQARLTLADALNLEQA